MLPGLLVRRPVVMQVVFDCWDTWVQVPLMWQSPRDVGNVILMEYITLMQVMSWRKVLLMQVVFHCMLRLIDMETSDRVPLMQVVVMH